MVSLSPARIIFSLFPSVSLNLKKRHRNNSASNLIHTSGITYTILSLMQYYNILPSHYHPQIRQYISDDIHFQIRLIEINFFLFQQWNDHSITPWKRRKPDNDFFLCFLSYSQSSKQVIKRPSLDSLSKVVNLCKERESCSQIICINDVVKNHHKYVKIEIFYLKICYSEFGNMSRRDGAGSRYE